MRLPHAQKAHVPQAKIVDYLLSATHRAGKHKAAFFTQFGFHAAQWRDLADALRKHVEEHEVAEREDTVFGIRYVVIGTLRTSSGSQPLVCSVWFVDNGASTPRFITAFPARRTTP